MKTSETTPPRTLVWKRQRVLETIAANALETCLIKSTCQSCAYINEPYQHALKTKYSTAINTLKEGGLLEGVRILEPVSSPRQLSYRTQAKLAVRAGKETRFSFGLFKPGTHELVDISSCPLHVESITKLLPDLRVLLEECPFDPYSESDHLGDLRYLSIRAAARTPQVQLTFVMRTPEHKKTLKGLAASLRARGHQIVSMAMNVNADRGNAIFGPHTEVISGASHMRVDACGLSYRLSPTAFFQMNPFSAELLYRRVEQLISGSITSSAVAWDLYCGVGQISLILARAGFKTLGIEENPAAIEDARANAEFNDLAGSALFFSGRAEAAFGDIPAWARNPQVIVANPSRRGIDRTALQMILNANSSKFIYVSCDATSLARDSKILSEEGMQLQQLEAFDMFPFTDKLEWIAVFNF